MTGSRRDVSEPTFEELSSYLDGELPAERLAEIDRWLFDHPKALRDLQKIRSVETALRSAAKPVSVAPAANRPKTAVKPPKREP